MDTQAYSARLGRISPAQFQAALDRFALGAFVRAVPIPLGNFGQNVFVTATSGEYVLRGAPHYAWQFPKERLIAHLLHERTGAPSRGRICSTSPTTSSVGATRSCHGCPDSNWATPPCTPRWVRRIGGGSPRRSARCWPGYTG